MFNFFGKKKSKEDIDSDDVDIDIDEEETEESKEKNKKKSFLLNKILKVILFIIIIGAIGVGVKKFFFDKEGSNERKDIAYISASKLGYVEIENKVLLFTYENSPSLYKKMLEINSALQTVSNEINRIEDIKFKYAKYTSIINPEIIKLKKIKNNFEAAFLKVKNGIEKIYVITIINKEKGEQIFKTSALSLKETLNGTLMSHNDTLLTIKRGGKKEKTFFEKIKSFF